jgi:hypothetical protein
MSRTSRSIGFGLTEQDDAYVEAPSETRESRNSLLHQVTRTVCRDCNNGWMSRLEQDATPILTALIGAVNAGSDVTLDPSQAKVLARWATKTAWTSELASLGDHNQIESWIPPRMRHALTTDLDPPPSSWVWLAAYRQGEPAQSLQARVEFDPASPPDGRPSRRFLATCLMLRGVALLTFTFDEPVRFPPPLKPLCGLRVWPRPMELEFPPPPVSYRELHQAISNFGDWLPLHDRPFRRGLLL